MVAHSEILLFKCAQFRDEGQFIDVRLKVREDIFPAHRIVLAANSDYFHAMFTDGMKESNQEVIELKDESISPDAFKVVVDSIYTGDLRVNEENVFEVLAAADHLQVTTVVQQCCDFLKREFIQLRLDLHNYCLLTTVADRHGLGDLQEAPGGRGFDSHSRHIYVFSFKKGSVSSSLSLFLHSNYIYIYIYIYFFFFEKISQFYTLFLTIRTSFRILA